MRLDADAAATAIGRARRRAARARRRRGGRGDPRARDRAHGRRDRGDHGQPGHRPDPRGARRRRRRGRVQRRRDRAPARLPGGHRPGRRAGAERRRRADVRALPRASRSTRKTPTSDAFDFDRVNAVLGRAASALPSLHRGPGRGSAREQRRRVLRRGALPHQAWELEVPSLRRATRDRRAAWRPVRRLPRSARRDVRVADRARRSRSRAGARRARCRLPSPIRQRRRRQVSQRPTPTARSSLAAAWAPRPRSGSSDDAAGRRAARRSGDRRDARTPPS